MRCNQRSRDRRMEEGIRANKILGKTRESSSGTSSTSSDSLAKENLSTSSMSQLPSSNLASRPLSAAPSFSTVPDPRTMSMVMPRSSQGYAVHPLHNAERMIAKSFDSLRGSPLAGPPTTASGSASGPSRASSSLSKASSPPTSPKSPKSPTSRSIASRTPSPTVVQEEAEEASAAPSVNQASSAEEANRPAEAAPGSPSSSTAPRLSLSDLPRLDTGLMGDETTSGDHGNVAR
ncbi:BQ2448_1604 [Microbotryum intermedium]|uniref:BQ2448_1604 protein n=1 Tax=Microbotryum intermedium TaxID=269621 RepID=A0A238F8N5_9BASI|nr:BQ2448_1604 [Microbotryum intermedium]